MSSANKLYPGLPNYTGPNKGYFTLLHHQGPKIEWSDDVMERVSFIKEEKAKHEVPIRLHHIVHYPDKLIPAKWKRAYAEWQKARAEWEKADADKFNAYIKKYVKDCRWNGSEIVFHTIAKDE